QIAKCSESSVQGVDFPETDAGEEVTRPCPLGSVGTIVARCVQGSCGGSTGCSSGNFDPISPGCQPLMCQAPTEVEYNATYSGAVGYQEMMEGECDADTGYFGTISRYCVQQGVGEEAVGVLEPPE